jgi:DNA polymerase I-like protein with 3'-5' exonuclease and polymerase domains
LADVANIRLRRVASFDHVCEFFNWLGNRREFLAVDVETTGLIVGHDYIRLAQFGDGETGWAFDYSEWKGAVADAIKRYDRPMVAHNLLFDSKMLKHDGIVIPQELAHDSMVMTHLADPKGYMGLKPAAARYIDKRAAAGQDLLKQAMAQGGWTWATIPTWVPAYWQYSAFDTCLSALMAEKLYPDTRKGPYEIELAAIHCLREAELAGLRVDEGYRQLAEWKLEQELELLSAQLPIQNPRSNQQVIEYLHSIGARWEVYNEDSGELSTDKFVLKWLASEAGGGTLPQASSVSGARPTGCSTRTFASSRTSVMGTTTRAFRSGSV